MPIPRLMLDDSSTDELLVRFEAAATSAERRPRGT